MKKREDLLMSVMLDHGTEYVMEIGDAYKFLDSLIQSTAITGYSNKTIKDPIELITIKYMTKQELKEIQLAQALDTEK